ncbi:efflux RND transporter periplasmic adaptor subunit [Enterococcus nangangensis]
MTKETKKKRFSKKQRIIMILSFFAILLVVLGLAVVQLTKKQDTKSADPVYDQYEVTASDPLMFDGVVQPQDLQEIYYDGTLGKITSIAITDQQEVKKGNVLLTYENSTVQDQVTEQERSLNRASLSVDGAKENLQDAKDQQATSQSKLDEAKNKLKAVDQTKPEGQAQASELQATVESLTAEVSAASESTKQMEQALSSAQLDLNDANQAVEDSKKNITTNVTSPIDGIVYLDEKGQSNPEVPVVKVVSKEVVVKASVTEFDYQYVKVDTPVTVTPVVSDEAIKGTITSVSQLANSTTASNVATSLGDTSSAGTSATYPFTVTMEKPLQYGFNVQISLALNELRVPVSAVVVEEDKLFVYQVTDNIAHKVAIEGSAANGFYTVTKGLQAKDKIILTVDDALKDGMTVAAS